MTDAISVAGLVKTFGSTRALDGLDLSVRAGEVHGFLGPNGAGKTTTIRILLGLIRADAGTATLLGGDPWREATALHRRLAYVPGDVTLWPNLSGGEVIDLLGRLRGGLDQRRRADLLERFDLDPTKKGRTYSKGNRQAFRDVIREEQRRDGRTVLLSSHILSEVEALCDRVTIIRDGRAVETGTLADMRHLTRTSIRAELSRPATGLAELPGVHDLRAHNSHVTFDVDSTELDAALRHLTGLGLRSLVSQPPTLEELFLRHYDRGANGVGTGESVRPAVSR
jgi:ABC-2 type transport system ATP-binding protein